MAKIILKKISVKNFAGVANGEYIFDSKTNIIEGASGTGKTTAYLAYLWALGFTIPTWEPQISGYRLYKAKTEVEAELDVDGVKYTLGKTNSPKYKINKFTAEEEYTGTDFKYIFDGQETSTYAEYKEKVAELFGVDYFTLELLSNISLFNGEDEKRWNKNERRKFLFKLFDLENKILGLSNEPEFECIKEYIQKGKDEMAINQILNTLKTDIENEIKSNHVIIEEKQREMAEFSGINFEELENKKKNLTKEIDKLSKQQKESEKNTIQQTKMEELAKLNIELNKIKSTYDSALRDYKKKIYDCESADASLDMDISFCKSRIDSYKSNIEDLEIEKENLLSEEFDPENAVCKACGQQLPKKKIDEMKTEFEKNKEKRLKDIELKAEKSRSCHEEDCSRLNTLEEKKRANLGHLEALKEEEPKQPVTTDLINAIKKLEEEISSIENVDTTTEIKTKIKELKTEYDSCIHNLAKKEVLEKIVARIEELKNRIKELGIQDSERIEKKNALQKYTQRKVSLVNEEINKHFDGVHYNFWKWNASSASATKDYMEVCSAVLNENQTEFDALSSGQQVKANLLTNNSLRKILGVNIPQFVDDVVLSDLEKTQNEWQNIYLLTNNSVKPKNLTLIKDCFSLKDCDVKIKDK